MLEMSRHICRRQKCGDNCRIPAPPEILTENINNPLPPEILCKVLGYLPQEEMVRKRSVCKYWRDTIDQHCPLTMEFEKDDEFLHRKLQLRIRKCVINWLPSGNSSKIKFAYPQSMKSITFDNGREVQSRAAVGNVRRLLNQVKPYLHCLEIKNRYLEKNIFTPPYAFPLVRELRKGGLLLENSTLPINLEILLSLRMSSLKILHVFFIQCDLYVADEIHKRLFTFLTMHRQSIKHLDVFIETKKELPEFSEEFELPTQTKSLLYDGKLQLEHFCLSLPLPSRYLSAWSAFLKSQKKLIHLSVSVSDNVKGGGSLGIPFNAILPGIQSSFATLRTLNLENILSVDHDGRTWIPFDCTPLRGAVNLTELSLESNLQVDDATPKPDANEGAEIINLGKIPLACLSELEIRFFVCDSGELKTLVDNSALLECLSLEETQAPFHSPRFASTGIQGGTIQSFINKPNKKGIRVLRCINYFNQDENDKLEAVKLLYPPHSPEQIGNFYRRFD